MKATSILFACLLLFIALPLTAQRKDSILLQQGWLSTTPNVSAAAIEHFNKTASRIKNRSFVVLQFEAIPSAAVKTELSAAGIVLLDYLPHHAYTATLTGQANSQLLQKARVRSLISLQPYQKLHPTLQGLKMPDWAIRQTGTVDVLIQFAKSFDAAEVTGILKEKNIAVVATDAQAQGVLTLRVATTRLNELAGYPFVVFVQPVMPEAQPLNFNNRWSSGAIALNTATALGGKGLNGEGVVIGIGDNADVQFHADFSGRLINRSLAFHEGHGTHVSGIAAGGGIINEQLRGYAPKATVISQYFTGILSNTPTYVKDHNMVVTNNSYSVVAGTCDLFGTYLIPSYLIDQQAFELPHLQHVFAAGNSGLASCAGYPAGYGNVVGGYQSAKNVISVGAATHLGQLWNRSSKGPVKDGRIKPEIVAMGAAVLSTVPNNNYTYDWGSSMAAPSVTGGLALLYQRYRQLHGGADPKSGLVKALLCNGAADKGNPGPDYSFGFGFMDLARSVDMMEKNRFVTGQISHNAAQGHTINVPSNTAELRVMLYWHDPPPAMVTQQALVNDLDLTISDPSQAGQLPKMPDPAFITGSAVSRADHLNNVEQVVINQPAAGTYDITITGSRIAQNPTQEYYLVYDIIPVSTELRYPVGGNPVTAGETVLISWDSYGAPGNTFTLQWSADNGGTWTDIATSVPATDRSYTWTAPSIASADVKVRVLRNGTSMVSSSQAFPIIGMPAISLSAVQCEGYIKLEWPAVAGATDYELMMLRGDEMVPVATTGATTYAFSSLSKDSTYWVSVRARVNGSAGRRAVAVSRKPENGTCSGAFSDHDLKLEKLVAPADGRMFTSTQLGNAEPVRISVKNLDDVAVNNYTVHYSVNGGPWTSETIATAIGPGAVHNLTFPVPYDFSAAGMYQVRAVVTNSTADPVTANDTLTTMIQHVANAAINLASDFMDDLENAAVQTHVSARMGLTGMERYDFEFAPEAGRLRTFVNSDFAYSGSRSITLDRTFNANAPRTTNYVTGTFNLSGYNAGTDDIRVDFLFNNQGSGNLFNKVWIRGNDAMPWIEMYNMPALGRTRGFRGYTRSASLQVSDSLIAYGQNLSASFQVRWAQSGLQQIGSPTSGSGISLDNIHLYQAINDIMIVQIDTPAVVACGLNSTTPVRVMVRNNSHLTLTNIPVRYAINNTWISETIPSIPGNTSMLYTFQATANFSENGLYQLTTVVSYPSDNFRDNDTVAIPVRVLPLVASFPYLQNFESGDGGWYHDGTNDSWAMGTPASTRVKTAASGVRAWKTNLAGFYNDMERSYLYSPCFQLGGLSRPTLSFSLALDLENCGPTLCDGAWIEYSTDDKTWKRLVSDSAFNFYDTVKVYWSRENETRWRVATINLPQGHERMRLRFSMFTDEGITREGIAVDDIHIYDFEKGIHEASSVQLPAVNVAGNTWTHFDHNGKRVASIKPGNGGPGNTTAAVFLFQDSVRYHNSQYYHSRNLVLQPVSTQPTDSISVRFYFLESETVKMVQANNCTGCTPPASAYDLGVSRYSDLNDAAENGTIFDNNSGSWTFLPRGVTAIVPYDKGYYAEFRVKGLSEFWLQASGFNIQIPHSMQLLGFAAQRQDENVAAVWSTAAEVNVHHYELQVARGNGELQRDGFASIGTVAAGNAPQNSYSYIDTEKDKTGVRYYRLKIVYRDGSFDYSEISPVVFSDEMEWIVFPNPSGGIFQLLYQGPAGGKVTARLMDAAGRVIKNWTFESDGFIRKKELDLTANGAGVYFLQVVDGERARMYKLFRK